MKRWQGWTRLGVVAAASFVLSATVLPQVASATGSSGIGTVTGSVAVTGAPNGFVPAYIGMGACPSSVPPVQLCADPDYTLAEDGTYSLSLTAGTWDVAAFYEINPFGGVFLGTFETVTVPSGGSVTENLTVAYQKSSTLKGQVRVTGVPKSLPVQELSVLLCPSYAPYNGVDQSIACVNDYSDGSGNSITSWNYKIGGLPAGSWTAYPGYCTEYGCAINAEAGTPVTLVAGGTAKADLTTPFLIPGEGLLSATVTVTGAPAGFDDEVAVTACPTGTTDECQTFYPDEGIDGVVPPDVVDSVTVLLTAGSWTVTGMYLADPFDNAVPGPSQTVTVTGGDTTTVPLTVPYQVPGTAAGSITVTGRPTKDKVLDYTVLACPASAPYDGLEISPECASEYSGPAGSGSGGGVIVNPEGTAQTTARTAAKVGAGRPPTPHREHAGSPFDAYQFTSLTPGAWILYAGYQTAFGSYLDPTGTTVTVTAGSTTNQVLSVPYQPVTVGAVVGQLDVVGAPPEGYQAGVEACTAPPTATSCSGEQAVFIETGSAYQLPLPPGTWWVAGFAQLFTGNDDQFISAPRKVTVSVGAQHKVNLTVTVGS